MQKKIIYLQLKIKNKEKNFKEKALLIFDLGKGIYDILLD